MGADISTQKNCYILFQSKQASLTININCVYYKTPWRNGSASDSRSEGCVFKSRRGQFFSTFFLYKLDYTPKFTTITN